MKAAGGNLSRLHHMEIKRKTGNEVAKLLMREITEAGSSEGTKAAEKPWPTSPKAPLISIQTGYRFRRINYHNDDNLRSV